MGGEDPERLGGREKNDQSIVCEKMFLKNKKRTKTLIKQQQNRKSHDIEVGDSFLDYIEPREDKNK